MKRIDVVCKELERLTLQAGIFPTVTRLLVIGHLQVKLALEYLLPGIQRNRLWDRGDQACFRHPVLPLHAVTAANHPGQFSLTID